MAEFKAPAYTGLSGHALERFAMCSSCAGIVLEAGQKQHTEFHKSIAKLTQKVIDIDSDVSDILEA